MSGAGTLFTSSSDLRLKKNIAPLKGTLEKLLQVKSYSFDWIDEEHGSSNIGFIAQEVMELFPEVVFQNQTDLYYRVNYPQFVPILVEAIKEQQEQIDGLREENEYLKEQLKRIFEMLLVADNQ